MVCLCVKEIEDSEFLEVMDVFDQEGSTTQKHVIPVPSPTQVSHMARPKSFTSVVIS